MTNKASDYHLYACLPFVELEHETSITIGPVIFWPASKYQKYIEKKDHQNFQTYIQSISQIKAKSEEGASLLINTIKLAPEVTTCLSISNEIPPESRESILIDSLYLLYFACTFRDLYYGNEIPSFDAFRKIIPCSLSFIEKKNNWENLFINEKYRESTVCIHLFDPEMCRGLGKMLSAIYARVQEGEELKNQAYKRLVRSIRYLIDGFFHRFVNLFENGINFSTELFEPEDVIFLASSFEALFDIDDKQAAADFKHKLRPLLHLKYAKPVELFWKWVADFYEVKRKIVHGGETPDPIFRINPNFEISHLLIGIKLFIYSAYYTLHTHHLLSSTHNDPYTPPDFKWIHPEEILLFFWTEENLLKKIYHYISQKGEKISEDEKFAEVHWLTSLFISMYERYFCRPYHKEVRFIPTPMKDLSHGWDILKFLEENPSHHLHQALAANFTESLQKRLRDNAQ
ncbi:MAG: hypothetical protein H0V82_00590 [Candidatus Protochlamydia sp.]|nr:hypothetical protein [Candidatus Protochlamydia sp.]